MSEEIETMDSADVGAVFRGLANWAVDVRDEAEKKGKGGGGSDCNYPGGPEKCPYHSRFVHKEGEGVHSHYNAKKVVTKGGKSVYVDSGERVESQFGKKKKGEKFFKMPEKKEGKGTPNLDTFKSVKEVKKLRINEFAADECYVRSAEPIAGYETKRNERLNKDVRVAKKGDEGKPLYKWTRGGKEIPEAEALRLEGALGELKQGAALSADSSEVRVRPDLATGFGQVVTYKNGEGKQTPGYTQSFHDYQDKEKWERLQNLYSHYDDIIHNIMADCQKGNKEAIAAYFMYRTKIRVGSKSNPKPHEGRGVCSLTTGNVRLDGDTVYVDFPAKNGYWHVSCEDKFLAKYLRKRKTEIGSMGEGMNSAHVFETNYGKVNAYLKDVSRDYVDGDDSLAFRPHNFRHFAATRIAMQRLEEYAGKIDPEKDKGRWQNAVCKAVDDAARLLNDTPKMVFEKYIIPQMFLARDPKTMYEKFPALAEGRKDAALLKEKGDDDDDDD